MGNKTSSTESSNESAEKEFNNFYDIIDYIATHYILTMDFTSLSKLSEKEYCDNLVVLTSDIITKYFNDMEITFMDQRIKSGVEVNQLAKEKIIFVGKDQLLNDMDISNDAQKSIKKKRVCIGIAKFYVKIAHIFAAIVMTINPVYTYTDETTGQKMTVGLMDKNKIPKNTNRKLLKFNICDNRIHALNKTERSFSGNEVPTATATATATESELKSEVKSEVKSENIEPTIKLNPKICDFNKQSSTLENEPGIPELMTLYLDDEYDYSTGVFTGMSETTKKQFDKDLRTFYTAFTGNETMPSNITKFSDIKLRNFDSLSGCSGEHPSLKIPVAIDASSKIFIEYAKNTQKMIKNAADNQQKLLAIINELFSYVIDPYTKKQKVRVNPKLTDASLQTCVVKTRKMIIDLYVKCEMDFINGIKLYEAIVETNILKTTQSQINHLETKSKQIIHEMNTIVDEKQQDRDRDRDRKHESPNIQLKRELIGDMPKSADDMFRPREEKVSKLLEIPGAAAALAPPAAAPGDALVPPAGAIPGDVPVPPAAAPGDALVPPAAAPGDALVPPAGAPGDALVPPAGAPAAAPIPGDAPVPPVAIPGDALVPPPVPPVAIPGDALVPPPVPPAADELIDTRRPVKPVEVAVPPPH